MIARCSAAAVLVLLAAGGDARGAVTKLSPPPAAAVDDPRRLVVAVVGDSLSEGAYLPDPATQALGPQMRARLRAAGRDTGARGFVPAHPATLEPVAPPHPLWPVRFTGSWTATTGAPDGRGSALQSRAEGSGAAAAFGSRGDATAVLLTAGHGGRATLTDGTRQVVLAARSGDRPLRVGWLATPRPALVRLKVDRGPWALMGFFERNAVRDGAQTEISMLVRGGARAGDRLAVLDGDGLGLLRPNLTLLALGTNDAFSLAFGDAAAAARAERGLRRLARIARRSGACIALLPPSVDPLAGAIDAISERVRAAARAEGCPTSDVLVHALDAPGSRLPDGVHPTPAGVARLADALVPLLGR